MSGVSEALLWGGSLCPPSEFQTCLCRNFGGSPCHCQNFAHHFAFGFVAVVISWWRSCRSSPFQFLHVAVSEPCRLLEFYPNRASLLETQNTKNILADLKHGRDKGPISGITGI